MSETTGNPIPTLATLIRDSKRVSVFTGAGMSTESPALGVQSQRNTDYLENGTLTRS